MLAPTLLYLVIMFAYVAIRPSLSYTDNGNLKPFGTGQNKTMFPLWIIAIVVAVIVAFLYSVLTV